MSRVFGKLPTGNRMNRVRNSPQYQHGKFSNQSLTPDLTEDATMWKVLKAFRNKPATVRPSDSIPAVKPDLSALPHDEDAIIWLGHSSYYIQFAGLKMLVDPILSNRASPLPGMIKAFSGTDIVKPSDFPMLDYVLISHDHYDHLDYSTVQQLRARTGHWLTSLGVGAHLEYWGVSNEKITELDWWEQAELPNGCKLTATPARHFSGRGLKRAQSLWSSFVLQTPQHNYYLGGDSGWDTHFAEIGKRFGPFDLAILECGQYHPYWKHIHMMPEEVIAAAEQLQARCLLPVHWGKFALALHPWNEPITRLLHASAGKTVRVLTPMIGQTLILGCDEGYDQVWWDM